MSWSREPVLISALIAGVLTAVGGALVAIGEGVDPLVAIGAAVVELGVIVGGGALGRSQAWSPDTVESLHLDAETVLDA